LRPLACWDCGFETRSQGEVFATSRSPVQIIPTEFVVWV